METEMKVDENRLKEYSTIGIYVRSTLNGKWGNYDISHLDKKSLFIFLRSRGGENLWAENVVAILLGHSQFDLEENNESTNKKTIK